MRTRVLTLAAVLPCLALAACGEEDEAAPPAATATQPATAEPRLRGEETVLRLRGFATRAGEDSYEVSPLEPARARRDGRELVFPVDGGRVTAEEARGVLEHGGGIRFTLGDRALEATDLAVDTRTGTVMASVTGSTTPFLRLDTDDLQPVERGGSVVVRGIGARLSDEAAAALNDELAVTTFVADFPMGTLTLRLRPETQGSVP